ncbi:hypothetical protein EJB05_00665, partial [Eragrostis curvula]
MDTISPIADEWLRKPGPPFPPFLFLKPCTRPPPQPFPSPSPPLLHHLLLPNPNHGVARRSLPHRPRRRAPPCSGARRRSPPGPASVRCPAPPRPVGLHRFLPHRRREAVGCDDGIARDRGGGDGAAHGAPGRQRAGLLRALPGYLLPPHLSGSLMSSKDMTQYTFLVAVLIVLNREWERWLMLEAAQLDEDLLSSNDVLEFAMWILSFRKDQHFLDASFGEAIVVF